MEQTGTIFKILEPKSGTSARTGKEWMTQSFIIDVRSGEHGQYTRKMMFSIFGEDKIREAQLFEGKQVKVSFDIECRESKTPGTWFNDLRAWKVEQVGGQQPSAYAPTQQYPPQQPQYMPQPQQQNGFYQPQAGGYPPNTGYYQPQPAYQPQQQFPPQQPGGDLPF